MKARTEQGRPTGGVSVPARRDIHRLGRLFARSQENGTASAEETVVAALEAEVTLLREENASLKCVRSRAADPGSVVALMRSAAPVLERDEDMGDDAWHVLAEALALKESLVHVCQEIEAGMQTLRSRLSSLDVMAGTLSERAATSLTVSTLAYPDREEASGSDQSADASDERVHPSDSRTAARSKPPSHTDNGTMERHEWDWWEKQLGRRHPNERVLA